MQLVPSSILALLAVAALAAFGVRRGLWAFLALTPFGAAAAFNLPALGGATIGVADLGAVAVFGLVLLTPGSGSSLIGTLRPFRPGFFLGVVLVVAAFSAIFLPRVFAGQTEVFGIARGTDGAGIVSFPLRPTTGNITQLFRLTLGILVFIALATAFRRRPEAQPVLTAMIVTTTVHAALGLLDVLTFTTGTAGLLEPIRTANYAMHITDTMAGLKRMVGGFPEASSFGFFSLGLFGFWLRYWIASPRSRAAPWMLALATIAVLRSTSSSAYVALAVFVVGFGLVTLFRNLRPEAERRSVVLTSGGVLALWLMLVAAVASYELVQPVTDYLDRALFDKLETSSGVERMSWNAQALQNFQDTYGFGAGLGAVRASNWLIACLASIGLPGTLFFLCFLTTLALAPTGRPNNETARLIGALKAGCLALVSAAILTHSTPDLGLFFFALAGLAVGLSRGSQMESRSARSG
jgi:hypothetical protein